MFKKIWPDGVWSYTAHNGTLGSSWPTAEKGVSMPIRYSDSVWTRGEITARGGRALLKPRPGFWCYTQRARMWDWSEPALFRDMAEDEIMRGHDGVSDFGVDFFPLKAPDGRYTRTVGCGRGTGGPTCSTMALLAPGADGPIATERFEMFREGVEIAEAILFIERALQDKKISGDLEQRANRCLDERSVALIWRWTSGRSERDQQLLALAGEVAAQAGK